MAWMVSGSIPGRGKRFFFSSEYPDWLWGPPDLLVFRAYWGGRAVGA